MQKRFGEAQPVLFLCNGVSVLEGSCSCRHTEEERGGESCGRTEQQKRGAGKIQFREKVEMQENCICGFPSHTFLQGRG